MGSFLHQQSEFWIIRAEAFLIEGNSALACWCYHRAAWWEEKALESLYKHDPHLVQSLVTLQESVNTLKFKANTRATTQV